SRAALVRADATDAAAVRDVVAERLAVDDRPAAADLVLADPPWGTLHGSHAASPALHADLLRVAHAVTAPGGRLVVLTHEVKVMERVVREAAELWAPVSTTRVFAKGHHPRVHVLRRV
ncbi:RNA methyltransferase, partial [Cellulomonas sp. 179-A 9B4 NHS]